MGDFGLLKFKDRLTITGATNNFAHEVSLSSFSIMKGQITYGELHLYRRDIGQPVLKRREGAIMLTDAFRHRPGYVPHDITWHEANGYCRWLAGVTGQNRIGMEGLVDGSSLGEWAADWYDENYFKNSPRRNPLGPASGTQKAIRKGAYRISRNLLSRTGASPDEGAHFRCVLDRPTPWR